MRQQAAHFGAAELSRAADIVNAGLTEMRGATAPAPAARADLRAGAAAPASTPTSAGLVGPARPPRATASTISAHADAGSCRRPRRAGGRATCRGRRHRRPTRRSRRARRSPPRRTAQREPAASRSPRSRHAAGQHPAPAATQPARPSRRHPQHRPRRRRRRTSTSRPSAGCGPTCSRSSRACGGSPGPCSATTRRSPRSTTGG